MGNNNKNLVCAARYIDAMYDIQIDENDPNLDQIIQKVIQTSDLPKIEKYWNDYQLELNVGLDEKSQKTVLQDQLDSNKKESRFYRGVLIENDDPQNT